MNDAGIPKETLDLVRAVLRRHSEVNGAKIFGSRATGTYKRGSDLDLALFGDIPFSLLAHIAGELDDLTTPYRFDVLSYESLTNPDLKQQIDRNGKILF